jgi:hypothetical protein
MSKISLGMFFSGGIRIIVSFTKNVPYTVRFGKNARKAHFKRALSKIHVKNCHLCKKLLLTKSQLTINLLYNRRFKRQPVALKVKNCHPRKKAPLDIFHKKTLS